MRPLPADRVFDRSALRGLGWSDAAIDRATRSGKVLSLRHGYYTHPGAGGEVASALAAVRAVADSVISHRSAGAVHELPVIGTRPVHPELTVNAGTSGSDRRALLHRATLRPDDVVLVGDVPVTSVARTLLDIARLRPLHTSVPAIDAALHKGKVTRAELERKSLECWNWPGIRRALRALRLSDGRSESPLESISRLAFPAVGIPAPELQAVVLDRRGFQIARLDFYWDRFGVAGEADGRDKYDGVTYGTRSGTDVLFDEKQRQHDAEAERLEFARWGWQQVWPRAHGAARRIRASFDRGAMLDAAGLPRRWTIELTARV